MTTVLSALSPYSSMCYPSPLVVYFSPRFSPLLLILFISFFFFSSRRRHTRSLCDWSSDVCSSDLLLSAQPASRSRRRRTRPCSLRPAAYPPPSPKRCWHRSSRRRHCRYGPTICRDQIGRASCRERVQPRVVDST